MGGSAKMHREWYVMHVQFPLTHACINPIDNTPEDARGGIYYYPLSSPIAIQTPCPSTLLGGARVHRVTACYASLTDLNTVF